MGDHRIVLGVRILEGVEILLNLASRQGGPSPRCLQDSCRPSVAKRLWTMLRRWFLGTGIAITTANGSIIKLDSVDSVVDSYTRAINV
jgi:hypothetical protein